MPGQRRAPLHLAERRRRRRERRHFRRRRPRPDDNNRVMKFSKDGKFIKAWGKTGYAPGEFRTLHGIAIDSRGRVFVADRNNNRIQIFDQEGKHLDMAAVRHAERHRLRRQGSDLCRRLRVGQREQSRVGARHPHRRCEDGLGHRVHSGSGRRSQNADRQRAGVRGGRQARQRVRRRAPPARAPEVRQGAVVRIPNLQVLGVDSGAMPTLDGGLVNPTRRDTLGR